MRILKSIGKFALDMAKSEISDFAKSVQLQKEAMPITQDKIYSFKAGDFVRDASGNKYYMVVKPKTTTDEGILAVLKLSSCEWYYRLEYDPYLGGLARDLSKDPLKCRDLTDAGDKSNGVLNTALILKHKNALELEIQKHNSFLSGPAPIHYFPALDFVKEIDDKCYLPAINELYDSFYDKDLINRFRELVTKCGYKIDDEIYIWSSTENTNNHCYGEDAFSLLISPHYTTIVQSRLKSKSASVLPFKKI